VLESDAREIIGLSQMCLGDRDAARVTFMDTAVLAEQAQTYERVVASYLQLVNFAGQVNHFDEAKHWLQLARETMTAHGASVMIQAELEYYECYLPFMQGDMDAAEPHCRRSCELFRTLPTRLVVEGDAAEELGATLGRKGKFAEASAAYREAQEIYRQVYGPDSTNEIHVLEMLANDESEQDHLTTALTLQQQVVAHASQEYPDQLAIDLAFYGSLLTEVGRAKEALPILQRAVATAEKITAEHDYEAGMAREMLGDAYLALGQPQLALGNLEAARRMIGTAGDVEEVANIDFALAKALWEATPRHSRAVGLARQARDYMRAHPLGALRARRVREVEAWLVEHVSA
jgi:tetratricopeptide (TPR) repeat protein